MINKITGASCFQASQLTPVKLVHDCFLPKDHSQMIAVVCIFLINLCDLLMLKLENEANF